MTYVLVYILFWQDILGIFKVSPAVIECARDYIIWIIIVPLIGFAPFLMDGILIGATKTKPLRNSMFLSTVLFFSIYYLLTPVLGNNALWMAFILFLISRAVLQFFMSDRLEGLIWQRAGSAR